MFKCPYSPCVFETKDDLDKHMQYYGNGPETHKRKWERNHREVEKKLKRG